MKTIDEIIDILEWFNIENDVFFNNSFVEYEAETERILSTIEGYNHTTVTVEFDKSDIEAMKQGNIKSVIVRNYLKRIDDFDVDDEFNMLWSHDFAVHNQFKPSQFIRILEEDKAQFEEIDYNLIA